MRKEWGFDGFVISDAFAVANMVIQGLARDKRDAALRGIKAGLNMDMSSYTYTEGVAALVEEGLLTVAEIEELVRPILALKVKMGLFENPYVEEGLLEKVVALPEHREISRWSAQRSMVLLRNEGGFLPLSKDLKVSEPQIKVGDGVTVSVDVTNTGSLAGDEVVQLYIHQRWGTDTRPMRELKGFERVTLQMGETKKVTFQLGPDELRYWSTNAGQWIQDAADFDIWVGADSLASLHADLKAVK